MAPVGRTRVLRRRPCEFAGEGDVAYTIAPPLLPVRTNPVTLARAARRATLDRRETRGMRGRIHTGVPTCAYSSGAVLGEVRLYSGSAGDRLAALNPVGIEVRHERFVTKDPREHSAVATFRSRRYRLTDSQRSLDRAPNAAGIGSASWYIAKVTYRSDGERSPDQLRRAEACFGGLCSNPYYRAIRIASVNPWLTSRTTEASLQSARARSFRTGW
jgi:hypothetical protein